MAKQARNDLAGFRHIIIMQTRIDCCFKVCISLLKLGKEFHGISFDMTVSSAAVVFARFIILEWLRREDSDPRTAGEMFFMVYDEVRDMELSRVLKSLLEIFTSGLYDGSIHVSESVRVRLVEWFFSQPCFVQAISRHSCRNPV